MKKGKETVSRGQRSLHLRFVTIDQRSVGGTRDPNPTPADVDQTGSARALSIR